MNPEPLDGDATPTPAASAPESATAGWRIDDLAQRAGLTVDTIRYYQREGLLSPGRRGGRTNLYFGTHLERLERIKELQQRRFSLAAIRVLLEDEHHGLLDSVFVGRDERTFTFDELVERSGVDPRFVTSLQDAGILRSPTDHGQDAYDADDLDLVCSMTELRQLGLHPDVVTALGQTYAEGIDTTQRAVTELLTNGSDLGLSPAEVQDLRQVVERSGREMFPITRRIVDYTFRRTIQQLVLDSIARGAVETSPASDDPVR